MDCGVIWVQSASHSYNSKIYGYADYSAEKCGRTDGMILSMIIMIIGDAVNSLITLSPSADNNSYIFCTATGRSTKKFIVMNTSFSDYVLYILFQQKNKKNGELKLIDF